MDEINLKNSKGTYVFRTINKTSWKLRCKEFSLGPAGSEQGEFGLIFEPQLPYIYLSPSRFLDFSEKLNLSFGQ